MKETMVEILCEGMIRKAGGFVVEAHSSSILVYNDEMRAIVDTSSSAYREKLLSSLRNLGIGCNEIDVVVVTHLHHDHTGNNDLFARARFIAHANEYPPDHYMKISSDVDLFEGVHIVHTPGHTRGSISVFVESESRVAIVGDALPTRDNYAKWLPPAIHYDASEALESIKRIVGFADLVIPGHDRPFKIDR
ncbi:MAG: MBL fold metallo-hydrolase [Methanomassiliicoccales archaeon]|jgi:glyoxylase-like metal-dependent hydrolase (beta-lactamase superfamily II)|nr:MBL fold metallo-hydrolase [Methanomassiliicoccales archaeon]